MKTKETLLEERTMELSDEWYARFSKGHIIKVFTRHCWDEEAFILGRITEIDDNSVEYKTPDGEIGWADYNCIERVDCYETNAFAEEEEET